MMELVKKNIHMNRWKGNVTTQLTLDDDFIVPDTMDDMEQVILDNGEIVVESSKNQGEKVAVKGKLEFRVLYRKEGGGLQTLGGAIPFEESINVPGLEEKDYVQLYWDLEDLNAGMINSRKLSVKAIVTLEVRVEALLDVEAAVDVDTGTSGRFRERGNWNGETPGVKSMDGGNAEGENPGGGSPGGGSLGGGSFSGGFDGAGYGSGGIDRGLPSDAPQVEILKRKVDVASIAVRRKDTYRIKEELQLSGNKPNIDNILWSEMKLRGVNTRPVDGKVMIDGEMMVFVIYNGEGENTPVQWLEESIPFSGELDLPEAVEEMVPSIAVHLIHKDIEAKPDYDGEMRELDLDAVLELDMKLYQEESVELLSDLYSTNRELSLQSREACFDQILTKNTSKCKITDKIHIEQPERVLQICHSTGTVRIDETERKEDGLSVEGVLEVGLLYLTADDSEPVKSSTEVVPFHYLIEANGINEESITQLTTGLEQMTAVMVGGDSVEVKAVISLDLLVLKPVREQVIGGVTAAPMDVQKLQKMPGIVGYIVQPEDTLWKIAKKFHTTIDTIMITNTLTEDAIKPGERLILVKELS